MQQYFCTCHYGAQGVFLSSDVDARGQSTSRSYGGIPEDFRALGAAAMKVRTLQNADMYGTVMYNTVELQQYCELPNCTVQFGVLDTEVLCSNSVI